MSLFKFKKAKVMVGEFDPDDKDEWTFLIKPQIQDVTLFVHFHKQWNVTEVPGVEAVEEDPDNGIVGVEGVDPISKIPVLHVFTGFIKDGNFVLDKNKPFSYNSFEAVKKDYLDRLTKYIEMGFTKDWNMYMGKTIEKPKYFGAKGEIGGISNMGKALMQVQSSGPKLTTKGILSHTGILRQSKSSNP